MRGVSAEIDSGGVKEVLDVGTKLIFTLCTGGHWEQETQEKGEVGRRVLHMNVDAGLLQLKITPIHFTLIALVGLAERSVVLSSNSLSVMVGTDGGERGRVTFPVFKPRLVDTVYFKGPRAPAGCQVALDP